jgi:hypothetical protein
MIKKEKIVLYGAIFVLSFVFMVFAFNVFGIQQESNSTSTTKTKKGIQFIIQQDRPIEDTGAGYIRPMAIDKYINLKFNKLAGRLDNLQARIESAEKRIEVLEDKLRQLIP